MNNYRYIIIFQQYVYGQSNGRNTLNYFILCLQFLLAPCYTFVTLHDNHQFFSYRLLTNMSITACYSIIKSTPDSWMLQRPYLNKAYRPKWIRSLVISHGPLVINDELYGVFLPTQGHPQEAIEWWDCLYFFCKSPSMCPMLVYRVTTVNLWLRNMLGKSLACFNLAP